MQGDFLIYLDDRSGVSPGILRAAAWVVRIALALVFASIVSHRFGLRGMTGADPVFPASWPGTVVRLVSWLATLLEIVLAVALLTGWQGRWAALLSAITLLAYGAFVCLSSGASAQLACFAFAAASAAFLLFAVQPTTPTTPPI